MNILIFDIETKSFNDLLNSNAYEYGRDITTEIICIGYKYNNEPVKHVVGHMLPECFFEADLFVCHNVSFEYSVMTRLDMFPEKMLDIKNWFCTSNAARVLGMPSSLKDVAKFLGLPQKLEEGNTLINKYSKPYKGEFRQIPSEDMELFITYCKRDVEITALLYDKFKDNENLKIERDIFELDFKMNMAGIPIHRETLEYLLNKTNEMTENAEKEVEKFGINVRSPKQVKMYFEINGVHLPDTKESTLLQVKEAINNPILQKLIDLRLILSKASVKKFKALQDRLSYDNMLRQTLQYFGAHTGRWSGRGFQPHNLPRVKEVPSKFLNILQKDSPNLNQLPNLLKKALPACVQPKENNIFLIGDFAAIEARVLAFIAGQDDLVDIFAKDGDVYKDMASRFYHKPVDNITKEQRQFGKTIILGCGYGMGANTFLKTCENMGISIDINQAQDAVYTYRDSYKKIKNLWYDCEDLFKTALSQKIELNLNKYIKFGCKGTSVYIELPSKRKIYYHKCKITDGLHYQNNKDVQTYLYGGKIVENIVQAIARDLLVHCLLALDKNGLNPILHIHDEIICMVSDEKHLEQFNIIMNTPPDWFAGFPLKTESEISEVLRR